MVFDLIIQNLLCTLDYRVLGNPDLCVSGKSCQTTSTSTGSGSSSETQSSASKKSSKLPAILGSTIPSFLVFWAIVGFFVVLHQKKKTAAIAAVTAGKHATSFQLNSYIYYSMGKQFLGMLRFEPLPCILLCYKLETRLMDY